MTGPVKCPMAVPAADEPRDCVAVRGRLSVAVDKLLHSRRQVGNGAVVEPPPAVIGPSIRNGRDTERDSVPGHLGENVRLEPVNMGATQLNVAPSEGAGVGAATKPVTRL
jgi:hypothetical protein